MYDVVQAKEHYLTPMTLYDYGALFKRQYLVKRNDLASDDPLHIDSFMSEIARYAKEIKMCTQCWFQKRKEFIVPLENLKEKFIEETKPETIVRIQQNLDGSYSHLSLINNLYLDELSRKVLGFYLQDYWKHLQFKGFVRQSPKDFCEYVLNSIDQCLSQRNKDLKYE